MSRMEKRQRDRTFEQPIQKKNLKQKIKEMETWKKVVCLSLMVLLLAGAIIGVVAWNYMNSLVDEMHEDTPENYDLSLVDVDGYINILLLGVDSRNMDNIKGTRSDMIMIASINKETNAVTLTSVYRDTFLKIGDTSTYDKITHACVFGGPEMTMKTLNQALDINISNYIVVNFKTVADVVDAVGGITVDVQSYEINQLNKYTIQTAKNIGREEYQLVQSAGVQTLEGVQAVSYGRIRKGVGDDIKRTERMRTVVSLVFDKVKTMQFSKVKEIINMTVPQVQTNLSMNDILALGIRLPEYQMSGGGSWPYQWTTGNIKGVSYLFPNGGMVSNTKQFHEQVFLQSEYQPSPMVNAISAEIIARIQAAREAAELKDEKNGESRSTEQGEVLSEQEDETIDNPIEEGAEPGTVEPGTENPGTVIDPEQPQPPTEPATPESGQETPNPHQPENDQPSDQTGAGEGGGTPQGT